MRPRSWINFNFCKCKYVFFFLQFGQVFLISSPTFSANGSSKNRPISLYAICSIAVFSEPLDRRRRERRTRAHRILINRAPNFIPLKWVMEFFALRSLPSCRNKQQAKKRRTFFFCCFIPKRRSQVP